ncbi:Uncharacterised protein [Vibrio metschnikovii]|nr:Uncharacterised protein [Vibrio metschnikovii]SUP50396.1 Uncharacterised protein [Vibrio metschnikovii]
MQRSYVDLSRILYDGDYLVGPCLKSVMLIAC